MADAEQALRSLYEDPSLREDMTDDEAAALLEWGAAQISALAADSPDDAVFEARVQAFRTMLMNINRYIGLLSYAPPEQTQAALNEALAAAPAAGFALLPSAEGQAQMDGPPLSGPDAVRALTAVLRPTNPTVETSVTIDHPEPEAADPSSAPDEDFL